MKHTIFKKTIGYYLIFGIIGFLILSAFTQRTTYSHVLDQESSDLYRESTQIASKYAIAYYSDSITLEEFQTQLEVLSSYLSSEIWIVTTKGTLLLNSADRDFMNRSMNLDFLTIDGFHISDFQNKVYQTGTFYDCFNEDMLTVYSPITIDYKVRGYVLIHEPLSSVAQKSIAYANIAFYSLGIIYLIGFVLLLLYSLRMILPIRKLTKASEQYAKGDFSTQIDIRSNGELKVLANTMNYMANELNTLEEDQRKFISNVSHDFRSPLTSIKGYIEAMLDGTIPVEMQEKYLKIIVFETERLTKLTQSLLDLNKFGRHGIMLDISDFDLNSLIRNTLLTFEGTCKEKRITFEVVLTGRNLLVTADMSKIQQVVYNLIDNAIKFSHQDSSIHIETNIKNEKVFVSIKDTGIGIPSDSIKKIWERFYKTDLSRGKDKKGTGLGLAIVKEIIQAHNENINCISTEGVGTEFIFTLPLSKKETA